MAVPFDDARCEIGSFVAEALCFPYHLARPLVEGCQADVFAASGDNDLVAVDEGVLADALVVGRYAVLLPIVERPEYLSVGPVQAYQLAHIADHVEAVVVDDGGGTGFLERLRPGVPVGDLPHLRAVCLKAGQLLLLLVLGEACSIDEAVAGQGAGVALAGIVDHPKFLGSCRRPFLQQVLLFGIDAAMPDTSEIDLLGS